MTLSFAPERIEQWPLAKLQPYARNAKTHGADQVAKIAASMAEFGWTVPCLVAEDGELIAGHGRVLAATQLGLTEAPVIVLGHLTEAQRRAYRIADNRLTESIRYEQEVFLTQMRSPFTSALAVSSSLRMIAMIATLAGFPTWRSAVYLVLRSGLKRMATRAGI